METCLAEIREAKEKTPAPANKIPKDASPEKRRKLEKYYAERAKKYPLAMIKAYQGLAWALLNTRQFSFVQ